MMAYNMVILMAPWFHLPLVELTISGLLPMNHHDTPWHTMCVPCVYITTLAMIESIGVSAWHKYDWL